MLEKEKLNPDCGDFWHDNTGIEDTIIAVQNVSNANVIYSEFSNAQANSVVIIAGRDVDSCVQNEVLIEKDR